MKRTSTTEDSEALELVILTPPPKEMILYGHQFLRRGIQLDRPLEGFLVENIDPENYIGFLLSRFPELPQVQELSKCTHQGPELWALLEEISDRIELTKEDAEEIEAGQARFGNKGKL